MYPLQPLKLCAWHALKQDPLCVARLDRMLGALGRCGGDVAWVDAHSLPDASRELASLWTEEAGPAGVPPGYTRLLIFTAGWLAGREMVRGRPGEERERDTV